eukprot:TRINITY_DN6086_c0_g1_i1.p1 TRINITY_DN6086_c0_g1~~TRINITY_DN6086_c0_g1_i1.p1  ORF type:complete len:335 (+),score=89.59 TRINITY_DN6086_c0_g1_i1:111-1115(+)
MEQGLAAPVVIGNSPVRSLLNAPLPVSFPDPESMEVSVPKDLDRAEESVISQPSSSAVSPIRDAKERTSKKKADQIATPTTTMAYLSSSSKGSSNPRRQMELEAYAAVISAFKVQGELTWKKEMVLQDLRAILKVSEERHRMELKRAEDTLSSLFPSGGAAKKGKRGNSSYQYDNNSAESSEYESGSDIDTGRRKKQKTAAKDAQSESVFTAQALPSSDNQPGNVNKLAGKQAAKTGKVKKEVVPGEKKKSAPRKKAAAPKPPLEMQMQMPPPQIQEAAAAVTAVPANPFKQAVPPTPIDPDIMAASESGDLEALKLILEQKRKSVQEELAQMK